MTSNDVVMASNAADADALEQQRQAVAELMGRAAQVEAATLAAAGGSGFADAHAAAASFATDVVRPWITAAQDRLLPGAASVDRARLLTEGLVGEARVVGQVVTRIERGGAAEQYRAVADVTALRVLLEVFFGKVTDMLMPALAEDASVPLATLVADLPVADAAPAAAGGGGCSCGEHDHGEPELDVRQIPHAIRHATVFGAFDAVAPGDSMILVAHHDPVPLLHQLADRSGGRLQVEYQERGPEEWRLRLTRA
ncbi:DUF2249 domain-containing protein [Gordonia shandongensis]|uniref:DUF2249 domain-containing protein n=1 Tax=Gordonia shandongensis TaxID=376351 RepID=UPI0004242449|nr:DUF2249 domain-containing protein [Gordonia shandongensis]